MQCEKQVAASEAHFLSPTHAHCCAKQPAYVLAQTSTAFAIILCVSHANSRGLRVLNYVPLRRTLRHRVVQAVLAK